MNLCTFQWILSLYCCFLGCLDKLIVRVVPLQPMPCSFSSNFRSSATLLNLKKAKFCLFVSFFLPKYTSTTIPCFANIFHSSDFIVPFWNPATYTFVTILVLSLDIVVCLFLRTSVHSPTPPSGSILSPSI